MQSATPSMPYIDNFDYSNTGQTTTPISALDPKIGYNCFTGGGCSNSQLISAVAYLNATYVGATDPHGKPFTAISLPANFTLGRPIFTQDVSLKKAFTFKEKYKLQIQYDVFNIFNISNLTNYGLGLNDPNFGVATNRLGASSPFGSGGPRAQQVGARFSF